jgi:hypothetical protein
MRSSHACGLTLAGSLLAFSIGLTVVPTASADPTDTEQTDSPSPAIPAAAPPQRFTAVTTEENPAAATACKQFSAAMNYAATNYEDFAYASAGTGDVVNYGDPTVSSSNVAGRTALRQAAAAAFEASTTPGLAPELSSAMQSWSLNAAKLVLVMGVQSGGDTLNSAATDLNNESHKVQMACAAAGTRA